MSEKPIELRDARPEDIALDQWLQVFERVQGFSFPALRASLRQWRATFQNLDGDVGRNDS